MILKTFLDLLKSIRLKVHWSRRWNPLKTLIKGNFRLKFKIKQYFRIKVIFSNQILSIWLILRLRHLKLISHQRVVNINQNQTISIRPFWKTYLHRLNWKTYLHRLKKRKEMYQIQYERVLKGKTIKISQYLDLIWMKIKKILTSHH